MITPLRRRLPLIRFFLRFFSWYSSRPVGARKTRLLHLLRCRTPCCSTIWRRRTGIPPLPSMDTTIPVIVRSRPTDGEVQEIAGVGGNPENARQILTPSAGTPRPPRGRQIATTPPASLGDPCDSPAAEDQRTCLNRSIARSDVKPEPDLPGADCTGAHFRWRGELEERFRQQQRTLDHPRDESVAIRPAARRAPSGRGCAGNAWLITPRSETSDLQSSLNRLRGLALFQRVADLAGPDALTIARP